MNTPRISLPSPELPKFIGSDDPRSFQSFVTDFNLVVSAMKLGEEDAARVLPLYLGGDAMRMYKMLDVKVKANYRLAVDALTRKFEVGVREVSFLTRFYGRRMKQGETIAEFLEELDNLASRAFPGTKEDERNKAIKKQFMLGLPAPLRVQVLAPANRAHSKTFEEIVELAQACKALADLEKEEEVSAVTATPLSQWCMDTERALQSLTAQVEELVAASRMDTQVNYQHQQWFEPPEVEEDDTEEDEEVDEPEWYQHDADDEVDEPEWYQHDADEEVDAPEWYQHDQDEDADEYKWYQHYSVEQQDEQQPDEQQAKQGQDYSNRRGESGINFIMPFLSVVALLCLVGQVHGHEQLKFHPRVLGQVLVNPPQHVHKAFAPSVLNCTPQITSYLYSADACNNLTRFAMWIIRNNAAKDLASLYTSRTVSTEVVVTDGNVKKDRHGEFIQSVLVATPALHRTKTPHADFCKQRLTTPHSLDYVQAQFANIANTLNNTAQEQTRCWMRARGKRVSGTTTVSTATSARIDPPSTVNGLTNADETDTPVRRPTRAPRALAWHTQLSTSCRSTMATCDQDVRRQYGIYYTTDAAPLSGNWSAAVHSVGIGAVGRQVVQTGQLLDAPSSAQHQVSTHDAPQPIRKTERPQTGHEVAP